MRLEDSKLNQTCLTACCSEARHEEVEAGGQLEAVPCREVCHRDQLEAVPDSDGGRSEDVPAQHTIGKRIQMFFKASNLIWGNMNSLSFVKRS